MTYEEKLEKIDKLIKENMHKEDNTLIRLLYSITFISDAYEGTPIAANAERQNKTMYSDLSSIDLLDMFSKKKFNNLKHEEMEHLFQELYNRETLAAHCKPNRIVTVAENDPSCGETTMGYMIGSNNVLNLNKTLIEKAVKDLPNACGYTSENVSTQFMMVATHETRHGIQYQQMADFFVDNNANEKDKSQAALNFMVFTMRYLSSYVFDQELQRVFFKYYWVVNNEHDANMAAIKQMKTLIDNGHGNKTRIQTLRNFAFYTMRARNEDYTDDKKEEFRKERVRRMHTFACDVMKQFEVFICDGKLKEKVLDAVKEYLDNSEGMSKFEKDLTEDYNLCDECVKLSDVLYQKKSQNKIDKEVDDMDNTYL